MRFLGRIIHKPKKMHPCWRELPFDWVILVIGRFVDEDEVAWITSSTYSPQLNVYGFFVHPLYTKWNELFSLCHFFHGYLFRLMLRHGIWSFDNYSRCEDVLDSWKNFEPEAQNLVRSVQFDIDCFLGLPLCKELPKVFHGTQNIQKLSIRFLTYTAEGYGSTRHADDPGPVFETLSNECRHLVSENGPITVKQLKSIQIKGLRNSDLCRLIEKRLMGVKNDKKVIEEVLGYNHVLAGFLSG